MTMPVKLQCAQCAITFNRDQVMSWKRDCIPKTLLKENGEWGGNVNIICTTAIYFPQTPSIPPLTRATALPAKMTCIICGHIFTRCWVKSWKGNWIYFSNHDRIICVRCTKSLRSPQRKSFLDASLDDEKDIELT